jgi:putative heme-binding domain-containing protein
MDDAADAAVSGAWTSGRVGDAVMKRSTTAVFLLMAALRLTAQDHSGQYPAADIASGSRIYYANCAACHGPTGTSVGGIDLRRGRLPRAPTDDGLAALVASGIPGTGMPPFRLTSDEMRGLIAFVRGGLGADPNAPPVRLGNAARGRAVFEGAGECLDCHRVGTAGGRSGPDLTDVGAARTPAMIQRSLVDPTGGMRPINRPVRAVTRDGAVITGRRLNEDTYTVQIVTPEGRLVSLVKGDLRDWSVGLTSPMPSYKESLSAEDLADLLGYLMSLKDGAL